MLNKKKKSVVLIKYTRVLLFSVFSMLLFRTIVATLLPYMDDTESRYAEIARIMSETNNWITLQYDYHIPFWAKPPLSTWLSSISFSIFGVNEFAGRLPALLLSLAIIFIVGKGALKLRSLKFLFFALILFTTPVFLIHMGVVSTDTALNFSIVLTLISFWRSIKDVKNNEMNYGKNKWGYLFFIALGLGLLSKGPLIFVLTAPPVFLWLTMKKKWNIFWQSLPWVLGIPIMFIMSVPWYILAENATPGFLDYFIIGEHFKRFLDPGWAGDKYGHAHKQARGMIWVFLLLFSSPWIEYIIYKIIKLKRQIFSDDWALFLLCWLIWIPLFFTLSTNILYTYTLPCTVPMALLIIHWMPTLTIQRWVKWTSLTPAILLLAAAIFFIKLPTIKEHLNTDKYLVEKYIEYKNEHKEKEIPYLSWYQRPYSSQFYTKGEAKLINTTEELDRYIDQGDPFFIELKRDGSNQREIFSYLSRFKAVAINNKFRLFLVTPESNK